MRDRIVAECFDPQPYLWSLWLRGVNSETDLFFWVGFFVAKNPKNIDL